MRLADAPLLLLALASYNADAKPGHIGKDRPARHHSCVPWSLGLVNRVVGDSRVGPWL